ncbi:hypothetical protein OJE16_24115 [Pantoea tagorei]
MEFIKDYWWILVILLLVGVLMNVYKDLKRIDHKKIYGEQARPAAASRL